MEELSTYIDVEFLEVSANQLSQYGNFGGELRFGAWFNSDNNFAFETYLPMDPVNDPLGGDVWLNMAHHGNDYSQGSHGYSALIRQIGQAMGIKYRSQDGTLTPQNIANPWHTSMPFVEVFFGDGRAFTRDFGYLDVFALQQLYGVNADHYSDDTVYTFAGSLGDAPFMDTIWDTGGINTLDLSASNRWQVIDIRQGGLSHVIRNSGSLDALSGIPSGSDTYMIAYGGLFRCPAMRLFRGW